MVRDEPMKIAFIRKNEKMEVNMKNLKNVFASKKVAVDNTGDKVAVNRVKKHNGNIVTRAAKTTAKVAAGAMLFEAGGTAFRAVRHDVMDTTKLIYDEVKNTPVEVQGAFGRTKYVDRHTGKKVHGYKPEPIIPEVIPNQKLVLNAVGACADGLAGAATVKVCMPAVSKLIDGREQVVVSSTVDDFDDDIDFRELDETN